MKIKKNEINYLQKRRRDDVGDIFEWNGKILRGIYPHKSDMVKSFFKSGFILELIKKKLFPKTWISNLEVDGYGLIIEHKKISPIIYPQEWTFEMLKDAALVVLEVAKIAKKYNLNMKDCHGLNILIDKNRPKFVDLGSFYFDKSYSTGWAPYQEFLRFYYYPLITWADGLNYTSKLSIFSANLTPHLEYYLYKYKISRVISTNLLNKIIQLRFILPNIACWDEEKILKISNKKMQIMVKIIKSIINKANFTISQNLDKLENRVVRLNKKNSSTQWADYHNKILKKEKRFNKIISLINTYCLDVNTAVDIAGNQGKFSEKLLKETNIRKVICQDLDENAIDIGYKRNKNTNLNISYVNYNAIAPIVKTTHLMPWERFKSDVVISLALLHHLILSQGFALEDILNEFKKYTKKYIVIEFMPRGLWNYEQGDNYSVPNWYNVEWFKVQFEKYFELLYFEQIEINYIVFIGKVKIKV